MAIWPRTGPCSQPYGPVRDPVVSHMAMYRVPLDGHMAMYRVPPGYYQDGHMALGTLYLGGRMALGTLYLGGRMAVYREVGRMGRYIDPSIHPTVLWHRRRVGMTLDPTDSSAVLEYGRYLNIGP